MKEIINHINELINSYRDELASRGIKVDISRKYLEFDVDEFGTMRSAILNSIQRSIDRKLEKAKGYNYEKNKYHCVVLSISPVEKNLVPKEDCRDYSFLLRKVERAHIGMEPQRIAYEENKIIAKIERRLKKIIKKATKSGARAACENNISDLFRYAHSRKYEYKKRFCGKERDFWDIFFLIAAVSLFYLIIFTAWLLAKVI